MVILAGLGAFLRRLRALLRPLGRNLAALGGLLAALGCSWISGLSACGPSPMVDACPRTCLPTYTWPAALLGSPTAWANRAGCRAMLHEVGAEPFKAVRGEEGSATPQAVFAGEMSDSQ